MITDFKIYEKSIFNDNEFIELINNLEFRSITGLATKLRYDSGNNPFDNVTKCNIYVDNGLLITIGEYVNKYCVKIGKNTHWTGGLEQSSVEYVFDMNELTFKEFEKGLTNVYKNQKYYLVTKFASGSVDTIYYHGYRDEIEKMITKLGYVKVPRKNLETYLNVDFAYYSSIRNLSLEVLSSRHANNTVKGDIEKEIMEYQARKYNL